jgi:trans-aconitate methyltransferase
LVYSAATIQWIPEKIAFSKAFDILKSGGAFAMFMTHSDEKSANEPLYLRIQEIYSEYFHPETEYTCKLAYSNVVNYGFVDFECRNYHKTRKLNADEYVSWISTHAPHITLQEPYRSKFFTGIKDAVLSFGNSIKLYDKIVLYLARKP